MKRSPIPLLIIIALTFVFSLPSNPAHSEEIVNFPDDNLEQAIRDAIDKPSGEIYVSDLEGLTELTAQETNIEDLTGLGHCKDLQNLNLYNNNVSDLTPVSNLNNLTEIHISSNEITDISPLSGLTNLRVVWASYNQISDLTPLSKVTSLEELLLGNNSISNLAPVSDLSNLTELHLDFNDISDLSPLSSLGSLEVLKLTGNKVSDLTPISELSKLTKLSLAANNISDISALSELTSLQELALWNNNFSNLSPVDGLSDLKYLYVSGNDIKNLSPISELGNLRILWVGDNRISDLTYLANLNKLVDLEVNNNKIPDIKPLVENSGIGDGDDVDLRANYLDLSDGSKDKQNIQTLVDRGTNVKYTPQKLGKGFETFQDQGRDSGELASGESKVTQVIKFTDEDENDDSVIVGKATIKNEGTATASDIDQLKLALTVSGGTSSSEISKTVAVDSFPITIYLGSPNLTLQDGVSGVIEVKPTISGNPTVGNTIETRVELKQTEGDITLTKTATDSTPETISSIDPSTNTLIAGWNLFSPPGMPQNPDPETALGNVIEPLALYYDYSSSNSYTNYPNDTETTQLNWKQGYWVYLDVDKDIEMMTKVPDQEQTLEFINQGWHMIGVPYTVDWSQVDFSDPSDFANDGAGSVRLVTWNPKEGQYLNHYADSSYVLSPWGGYWVYVKNASSSDPALMTVNKTDKSATTMGTKTPLPQSVNESELNYPPLPQGVDNNFRAFVYPNPVMKRSQVTFTVQMAELEKIKVTIMNTVGEVIYDPEYEADNQLTWNLKNSSGNKISNGIYLYKIQATGANGTTQASKVKPLLVLQ